MNCRHCGAKLEMPFVDLGSAPPSNAYLTSQTLEEPEIWYPLRVLVCTQCWLVQTQDFAGREQLFTDDYSYLSSYSTTWLAHVQSYVANMIERFKLRPDSSVAEIGANDGYLLQYVKEAGIPCYGVEPTTEAAGAAKRKGVEIIERFFGMKLARELAEAGRRVDLIVANNVLAHVPDINEFVAAFAILLKPRGVATFEFPHLLQLVEKTQFDTVYHEHYSYLSFTTVMRIFSKNGLTVFDVHELPTHGGSLRVFAQRVDTGGQLPSAKVDALLAKEVEAEITDPSFYARFQAKAEKVKDDLLGFLLESKRQGKRVAGYGAAAKGNTLLNYAGVRPDLLPYVVDRNPVKQGKFMPGSRIPIVTEASISANEPDFVLILPWNIKDEIINQLAYVREWDARFVVGIPEVMLL